jgi:hypothetical protein
VTNLFALYLAESDEQSFIQMYSYDLSYTSTGEIVWIPVDENFFWQASVDGVKVGTDEYALKESMTTVFDSGTSLAYFDKSNGNKIIKKLLKGVSHIKLFG